MSYDTANTPVSPPVPPDESSSASSAAVTKESGAQTPPTREENGATEPSGAETSASSVPKDVPPQVLEKLLRQHVWGAIGVGCVPIPVVDLAGLAGVQLNLIRKLAQLYGMPFFKEPVRNLLSVLVGSTLPTALAPGVASFAKIIPFIGQSVGVLSMSLVGGASTYAVGKVFIRHFASGGTFLTFDAEHMKSYYHDMFEEGKRVVARFKSGHNDSPDTSRETSQQERPL